MEDYMGQMRENSSSNNTGTTFLYGSGGGSVLGPDNTSIYGRGGSSIGNETDPANFHHLQYHHQQQQHHHHHPVVKIESGGTQKFHNYPSVINFQNNEDEALKAKIISHPHYSNLLQAYMDCQKVGAPPEIMGKLTAVRQEFEARQRANLLNSGSRDNYKDPELDQFMEAYYDMLVKYKEELTRPIQEAMEFMRRIESQLSTLTISTSSTNASPDNYEY